MPSLVNAAQLYGALTLYHLDGSFRWLFFDSSSTSPPMKLTIASARAELLITRQQQNQLLKKIKGLREYLREEGIDPDERPDYTERNTRIYEAWLACKSYTQVGREFNLTPGRISCICQRIHLKRPPTK